MKKTTDHSTQSMPTKTPVRGKRKTRTKPAAATNSHIDSAEALRIVMQLMELPGVSGREGRVAQFIMDHLRAAGVPESAIALDTAHKRTPIAGEVGNLILKLPGTEKGPRRLLMAHMDTVPVCIGSKPIVDGDFVRSADPKTGVGADDRTGSAAVLCAALAILRHKLAHPPLTFFWSIQEETGLHGVRHADVKMLGGPKLAFNFDGGMPEKAIIGATGGYRMQIEIEGIASHAGIAPEMGVSAIAIASLAVAHLHEEGWHGRIVKGRKSGTSNVGVIQGGAATNVITDKVQIRAEARSHDPKFRQQIVRTIEKAFQNAVKKVRSATGKTGKVSIDGRLDYDSFRLADEEASVLAAEAALRAEGLDPVRAISNGGLDANWMYSHGIPTVTLGCGQLNLHMTSELMDIAAFHTSCRTALRLATGAEMQKEESKKQK
jgi:tripeptide aminopeptidase